MAATALTCVALYTPHVARANGRFPKAQAIVLPAHGDGGTIYLRATFGVLVSSDAGQTWRWLCERALGFSSTWDPPLAATRDGRLWIALADGLHSTADGCSVDDVHALDGQLVSDITVDGTGDRVFAVTSPPGGLAFVWRRDAAAFTRLGKGISGFRFDTIDVALSKPSRLYLTATPDGKGSMAHLFRSDDGGGSLVELPTSLESDARLFVAAVDPRDADRLYVRALSAKGSDVLLSTDGGKTLRSVLHMKGAMFGFARTPTGDVVYAGSGDASEGIWRSTDRGETWQPGAKTSVFCLNAEGPRLLVCSNPYVPSGYAVADSTDQGATVTPRATFDSITGPVDCDGGSVCAASWPETRAAIAPSAHNPASAARAIDAGAAAPGVAGAAPAADRGSACGCRTAGAPIDGSSPGGGPWLALVTMLAFLARAAGRSAHPGSGGPQRNRVDGPPRGCNRPLGRDGWSHFDRS